jgi:hypothetical protein
MFDGCSKLGQPRAERVNTGYTPRSVWLAHKLFHRSGGLFGPFVDAMTQRLVDTRHAK